MTNEDKISVSYAVCPKCDKIFYGVNPKQVHNNLMSHLMTHKTRFDPKEIYKLIKTEYVKVEKP